MKVNDSDNDDEKKAANVENFINIFQHVTKTHRLRLSDMMNLKIKDKNQNVYNCFSIKNDDDITACIGFETKYYPQYIYIF